MPAKLDTAEFIKKSRAIHGDKYGYEKADYKTNSGKVSIVCHKHGDFEQRASNHMLGRGCPSCKIDATKERCGDTLESFVRKAIGVHGDRYDYSAVNYERSSKKVEVKCKAHGSFFMLPGSHISGKNGCPKCAGKDRTTAEFIRKANEVHGGLFGYQNTEYKLIKESVTITCKTHGDFTQTAENHLVGRGCMKCWCESYASEGEREIADWVESIGCKVVRNSRDAINGKLEVDIHVPEKGVGIEYNGCYWHSDKVEKNKRKHEFKHACATTNGLRLISVWDYEWKHKQSIVKRRLAHALGLSEAQRIGARECAISPIDGAAATCFYEANHIQGACKGGVIHLGLHYGGALVAAMSFTRGGTRRGIVSDGEWELARYATSAIVRGGASRLFSAFLAQTGAEKVWSFSDKQHFDGGLYQTLGFNSDGDLPADYKVIDPRTLTVWHKSLWQRKSIHRRLKEIGSSESFDHNTDIRTEYQIQDAVRVLRIWDAGKTRWVWVKPSPEGKGGSRHRPARP